MKGKLVMKNSTKIIHRAVIETLESRRLLSLTAPVYSSVGDHPQAVATADLNGDGRSDVVTANSNSNNVSVLLSNASGALQPAQHFTTGAVPHSVAVGDVSGDGKPDVVTANDVNVSVLLGNGDGTLQTAQNLTLPPRFPPGYNGTEPLPQTPQSVVVGDLNADGKLDLVVKGQTVFVVPYISPYGGTFYFPVYHEHVNVLIGNGGGSFAPANTYLLSSLAGSVAVGDFNGDTKADVVAAGTQVGFLAGNGNGTLQPPVNSGSGSWGSAIVGDFDGDAKLDLVLSSGGSITFAKGLGNGTFAPATVVYSNGTHVRSVVAGDMNADGKLDLVASAYRTTFESYGYYGGYNPTTREYTKVLLGFGDGTFSRAVSSTVRSYPERGPQEFNAVALGDFNADGLPDLATTDPANDRAFAQLNQPGWIIPGTVSISDAAAVTEGHSGTVNAVFTVTLDQPPSPAATVTVGYEILDGTATAASGDYVDASGTLTFTPGQTSKTIAVQAKGDRVGEFDEDFVVRLTDSVNVDITDDRGVGTILDDEPRIVSFTGGSVVEGNSGTAPLTFTVTLSAPSDAPVTLTYSTADSATDYVPVTDTLTFAPGQTTRTFDIQVKGDLVPEYTEQVYVNLIGATNALISNPNQAAGTITDTDSDPTISIANVSRAEGNSGQTWFEFVLTLSGRSEKEISVHYATSGGSAASSGPNKDYNADSTYASIYPGQISGSVTIYVIGDTRNESDETFFVNLSNSTAATIADNQAVGTILDDESRGKRWVGPASGGNWSTASNWSPSGVPSANSLVSIADASVTITSGVTVAEISLIGDAVLTVAPGGNRVLRTSGLFFGYYPKLDLNDNALIVDYTAAAGNVSPLGVRNPYNYTGIAGMIETGRGQANGWGIVTTRPDALNGVTTLGVGEASQVLGLAGSQTALFSGQTVDATTVLVKYTYAGDANLDGTVGFNDLAALAQHYNSAGGSWPTGDSNYDGKVDFADLVMLAQNYNEGLAPPAMAVAAPGVAAALIASESDVLPRQRRLPGRIFKDAAPLRRPVAAWKAKRPESRSGGDRL
jgi:hypothetical protein